MKKISLVGLVLTMAVMGGCAESSGVGDVQASGEGTAVSAIAEDEVVSLAESMASDMAASMFESMAESEREAVSESITEKVTETMTEEKTEAVATAEETEVSLKNVLVFGENKMYVRRSEEESKTVTIDSDVFPYDSEEIHITIDTEWPYYNDVEPYDCIDLGNLKNYPDLKKLEIDGCKYSAEEPIRLLNLDSAANLENLEEIQLHGVVWNTDEMVEIGSLNNLTIEVCNYDNWDFLGKLRQVETLSISISNLNDLSFINGMSSLTELDLLFCSFSNSSFDGLEENYSVKKILWSSNSDYAVNESGEREYFLTDITGLSKFRGLEYLGVSEDHLDNKEQRKKLQEKLPECEIH